MEATTTNGPWAQLLPETRQEAPSTRAPRNPAAVWRAIKVFGTQEAMAAFLRVTQATVSAWGRGDRPVPPRICLLIERETRKRFKGDTSAIVTCLELRPDIWAEPMREAA
jgi:DNA-binding transcriptional regulator YdaS (Cro superfamily)